MTVRANSTTLLLRCVFGLLAEIIQPTSRGADLYDIPPTVPPRIVDGTYFGTHLHRAVAKPGTPATIWPEGQIGTLRLWDSGVRWADIEPSQGRFDFRLLDAYVSLAEEHGVKMVLVLGSGPRWAAARPDEPGPYGPGSICEPANPGDWDSYVTAVVHRYRGRIASYELWNEPYFDDLPGDRNRPTAFFSGSVATMVELARRTRAVLDREDPSAVLLSPGFVGAEQQRFDMFLSAGGGRYIGGVAYHYYVADDLAFIALHRAVRATMARHGLRALPVHNTESGYAIATTGDAGEDDRMGAAVLLARSMVLGAFLGIATYDQYAWDNHVSGMVMPASQRPTPSRAAYASVRRWLVGTRLLGCKRTDGEVVRCSGTRGPDRLSIYWRASAGAEIPVRLDPGVSVLAVEHAAEPEQAVDLRTVGSIGLVVGSDPVAVWWRAPAKAGGVAR